MREGGGDHVNDPIRETPNATLTTGHGSVTAGLRRGSGVGAACAQATGT